MRNKDNVYQKPCKLFVYMTFGEWLRDQLKAKGMSNAELARRTHLSGTYIGNLVRGFSPNTKSGDIRPSEKVVADIARALEADLDEARYHADYMPSTIKTVGFDGLDKDDLREIAEFIAFRKARKKQTQE